MPVLGGSLSFIIQPSRSEQNTRIWGFYQSYAGQANLTGLRQISYCQSRFSPKQTRFKLAICIIKVNLTFPGLWLTWERGGGLPRVPIGEVGMNFEDDEVGLRELFQGVQYVPGTFPPVYMLDSMVISYDKSGRLQIVEASRGQPGPIKPSGNSLGRLIRSIICF